MRGEWWECMRQDYIITIVGCQRVESEENEMQLTTVGSYVNKDGNRYIIYSEYEEDNPSIKTTSVLKVEGDKRVTLIRNGEDRTRLILEKGKRHQCFYNTGVGSMMVGVFTKKIDTNLSDDGGQLEINYSLDINSGLTSLNQIFIDIKKGTKKNNVTNSNGSYQ